MKALIAAMAVLLLASCATTVVDHAGHISAPAYAEKVKWRSLDDGLAEAKTAQKPLLVDFAVPVGCPRCDFLKNNVYGRDELVAKINSDFIPVWIDLSRELSADEKALGERYDYKKDCLLLFLDSEGNVITDPEGKKFCFIDSVPPEVLGGYLDYIKTKYAPR